MRRDHALGVARGARGVEDDRIVVWRDLGRRHGGGGGDAGQECLQVFAPAGPRGGAHGDHSDIEVTRTRGQPLEALLVREQHLGATVSQAVFHLVRLPEGVHRHRDGADGGRGHEGQDPLWIVARGDGDAVALADAVGADQQVADPAGLAPGVLERQPFVLIDDEGLVAEVGDVEVAERGRRVAEHLQRPTANSFEDQFIGLAGVGQSGDGLGAGREPRVGRLRQVPSSTCPSRRIPSRPGRSCRCWRPTPGTPQRP